MQPTSNSGLFPDDAEELDDVMLEHYRLKNREHSRHIRHRKKLQFKELESALDQAVILHNSLREEFKQRTGREFHSEGAVLFGAVCDYRADRRGGARTKSCTTFDDKLERGRMNARVYRQRKKALEILMDGCYTVVCEENSAIRAYLDGAVAVVERSGEPVLVSVTNTGEIEGLTLDRDDGVVTVATVPSETEIIGPDTSVRITEDDGVIDVPEVVPSEHITKSTQSVDISATVSEGGPLEASVAV